MHLVLDPRAMADDLVAPRHQPAKPFGSPHLASRSPAGIRPHRGCAERPASILSVFTWACAIAFTCSGLAITTRVTNGVKHP